MTERQFKAKVFLLGVSVFTVPSNPRNPNQTIQVWVYPNDHVKVVISRDPKSMFYLTYQEAFDKLVEILSE